MFSAARLAPVARPLLRPHPLYIHPFFRSISSSTASHATSSSTSQYPPPASSLASSSSASKPASTRSYTVTRTPSQQLPVYQSTKSQGNRLLTKVQRVTGRVEDLKRELQLALGLSNDQIIINPVNRHIVIKGWRKKEVAAFLEKQSF